VFVYNTKSIQWRRGFGMGNGSWNQLAILVEGQTAESAGEAPSVGGEHEYLYSNSPLHLAAMASRYIFPSFFSSKVAFKSFKRVTKRARNILSSVSRFEFLKIMLAKLKSINAS